MLRVSLGPPRGWRLFSLSSAMEANTQISFLENQTKVRFGSGFSPISTDSIIIHALIDLRRRRSASCGKG